MKDSVDVKIPRDVLEYIEDGRNPNVYTRQFANAVVRENQYVNGKMKAHQEFQGMLGKEIGAAFPGLLETLPTVPNSKIDDQIH